MEDLLRCYFPLVSTENCQETSDRDILHAPGISCFSQKTEKKHSQSFSLIVLNPLTHYSM